MTRLAQFRKFAGVAALALVLSACAVDPAVQLDRSKRTATAKIQRDEAASIADLNAGRVSAPVNAARYATLVEALRKVRDATSQADVDAALAAAKVAP